METVLRIELSLLCVAILAVIEIFLERRSAQRSAERLLDIRLFKWLLRSTTAMLLLDATAWALGGARGAAARVAHCAVDIAYFCVHPMPTLVYIAYTDFQIHCDAGRIRRLARPLLAVEALLAALAISSPATGFIFRIDASNRYIRGPGFPVLAAMLFGLLAWSAASVVANRKRLSPKVFWTLLAYPLPVAAAALIQDLRYGLVLVWPVTAIFLLVAALNIQRRNAATDHLTGAANRRSLDEELERLVDGGRQEKPFGGFMADLDDFKSINDRLGHEAGDRALEDAAAILRASVRAEDLVARYGGDEFVVLLPGATEAAIAEIVRRLARKTESLNASGTRSYRLAFSVGAALYDPAADGSAAAFLARLDEAMYRDKAARKSAASQ